MDKKTPERMAISCNAGADACRIVGLLMGKLGMDIGRDAACNFGAFKIRHTVLNSMHVLIFFAKGKKVGGFVFWLDKAGAAVTAVSIPHDAASMRMMPPFASNCIESLRRLARKHPQEDFVKGPGAAKIQPPRVRKR